MRIETANANRVSVGDTLQHSVAQFIAAAALLRRAGQSPGGEAHLRLEVRQGAEDSCGKLLDRVISSAKAPTPDRAGHLEITVAALTRNRPRMLSKLLDSFDCLVRPRNCTVRFLIVENDALPKSRAEVDRRGGRLAIGRLDYVLEPELGIPFGRNRAAREAIKAGHTLLAFVDDDEVVDTRWLTNLIEGYRKSSAVLLGGPLAAAEPEEGLSWMQRTMHACIARRYSKKELRAADLSNLHGTRRTTVVTNNWLGEVSLFSEHGIWFDETMRFTGGTDSKFYAEVAAKALPTAWVRDAYVYESIPPQRLTFAYQFRRGRDQSNTTFRRKLQSSPTARWSVFLTLPLKALGVVMLTILFLPAMGTTMLGIARTLGWMAGRIAALTGNESALYVDTTGQ